MKFLFGYVVKGFAEWFTKNETEIRLAYKETDAESVFETLEDFAVELYLEMRGLKFTILLLQKRLDREKSLIEYKYEIEWHEYHTWAA